jgi:hypothetical protein
MRAYVDLLRSPAARRLFGASGAGKLGFATFPLAMVLLGHGSSGSFTDAGLVAGAWSIGGTLTAPIRGHLVDRNGHRLPMALLSLVTVVAVAGLAIASTTVSLVAFGALAGAAAPPIVASVRPLWTYAVRQDLVRSAYAADAVLTEVAKVCGPLVAAAAAIWSARSGIVTAGLLVIAGTVSLVVRPVAAGPIATSNPPAMSAVLAIPSLRLLLVCNVAAGVCLGALTVGLPARTAEHGTAAESGWLFACLGLGSAIAGAWFGARRRRTAPATGYVAGFLWLSVALIPAAVLPAGLLLAVVLMIAGGALAPITICLFELLDSHAPHGTAVSSMMWMVSAEELGIALGTTLSGVQAQQSGASFALSTAVASAGVGAIVLATHRGTLTLPSARVT